MNSQDYLNSLVEELRACEDKILRGFIEDGRWTKELHIIEARGFEIEATIREKFPDLDSASYSFNVHSPQ